MKFVNIWGKVFLTGKKSRDSKIVWLKKKTKSQKANAKKKVFEAHIKDKEFII
jgi:hypothetical protein